MGPARGDLAHWYYETIDIASFLKAGDNVIASVVWNFGVLRPWAQFSLQTAFVLQGNTPNEEIINTNSSWKVVENKSIKPISDFSHLQTFIVVGPGEEVDASLYPWAWEKNAFDASYWSHARELVNPKPGGISTDIDWVMTPRNIPLLENKKERLARVRRIVGFSGDASQIIAAESVEIPAHSKVSILMDNDVLTKGYPVIDFSGGKGSEIRITYAEALFSTGANRRKGHRDEIYGMEIQGVFDVIKPDGGEHRKFSPLWYRTYRYLQLDIETTDEALVLNDVYTKFSAYPFTENAVFVSNEPLFGEIWDVGWRTARLCAHETYYDCPYYEQLQYVGDTRIQALVSLYVSGDDRLMRKAVEQFNASRIYEGITHSRYPSYSPQFIPPYSLVWINMVHDYYMHRSDDDFLLKFQHGIESILNWYEQYVDEETGMLGAVPYWNFVDWADEWPWSNEHRIGGVPSGGRTGNSAILTLQLAYTLKEAAGLMEFFGNSVLSEKYLHWAQELNRACIKNTWCNKRNLFADTPEKIEFSQHANILGILSGAISNNEATAVMDKILNDKSLIQCTMYFRFYLFLAMQQTGHFNLFSSQFGQWTDMLDIGLTTFAEKPEPTRSDCHAWSASPLYFFLSGIAGVKPNEPGFKTVLVEPKPGTLDFFNAEVPHTAGKILVSAEGLHSKRTIFKVDLPQNINGVLKWKSKNFSLLPGVNEIIISD
jgi:hypothetical protein